MNPCEKLLNTKTFLYSYNRIKSCCLLIHQRHHLKLSVCAQLHYAPVSYTSCNLMSAVQHVSLKNLIACYVWAWGGQVNPWMGARRPAFKSDPLPFLFPKERENGLIPTCCPLFLWAWRNNRTNITSLKKKYSPQVTFRNE